MRRLLAACCVLAVALGPACYTGSARPASLAQIQGEQGWLLLPGVAFIGQPTQRSCGAAALAMVERYWGKNASPDDVIASVPAAHGRGLRAGELRDHARGAGLRAWVIKGEPGDLKTELERGRPLIVGLAKPYGGKTVGHFEVLIGLHPGRREVLTLDPLSGPRRNSVDGFVREWVPSGQLAIVVLPPAKS